MCLINKSHTQNKTPLFLPITQVMDASWVVITILLGSVIIVVRNPQTIPTDGQNFFEYVLEFIRDLSKTQIECI
jgi:F0F1-type ATP synthase membrane subunit a